MKVGYIRVSTLEQNEERQKVALEEKGCEKVFLDKLSGKDTNRPAFQDMLDYVREGDTLIISEYSRLARSTKDLLEVMERLTAKGVKVVSLKENLDTSTPQGKLMLTFFAGMAEFERALMLQRQAEGIAIAKAAGKYKGRVKKAKPANFQEIENKYRGNVSAIAKEFGVSRPTVYAWLKEN